MENLEQVILFQKRLHDSIIAKMKERNVKIRKFMLYVNNVLNENVDEIHKLYGLYDQLGLMIQEYPKSMLGIDPSSKKPNVQEPISISMDLKDCSQSNKSGLRDEREPFHAHDVNQAHEVNQALPIDDDQTYIPDDETLGLSLRDTLDHADEQDQFCKILSQKNVGSEMAVENAVLVESSPVSNLIQDVLSSVKNKPSEISSAGQESGSRLVTVPNSRLPSCIVDNTKSPCLFSDDEPEVITTCNNSDVTTTESQKSSIGFNSKTKKTMTHWPIGYPKSAPRGELVVEPNLERTSSRRARQTRLDGFLSKSSLNASSEKIPILSLNGSQHKKSTEKGERVVIDSESSDELEVALDLLHVKGGSQASVSALTEAVNQVREDRTTGSTSIVENNLARVSSKRTTSDGSEGIKKKNRKLLSGYRCKQCYEYYCTLSLSEEEIQQRLNDVCRHRAQKPPMETPPKFWNMSIMSDVDT